MLFLQTSSIAIRMKLRPSLLAFLGVFSLSYFSLLGQSSSTKIPQGTYLQLSGMYYNFGDFPFDRPNLGYHIQVAVGTPIKPLWRVGLSSYVWGKGMRGYHIATRQAGVGPHIRYMNNKWIAQLDAGFMFQYQRHQDEGGWYGSLSPSKPYLAYALRVQGAIRIKTHWVAGVAISFLPPMYLEGIRNTYDPSVSDYVPAVVKEKRYFLSSQAFIGYMLLKK